MMCRPDTVLVFLKLQASGARGSAKEETWEIFEHPTRTLVLVWVQGESWLRSPLLLSEQGLMRESEQAEQGVHTLWESGKKVGLEHSTGGTRRYGCPTQTGAGDEEECKMKL